VPGIFTVEVFEGKRIGGKEVAAELDPVFGSQRAIYLEDFVRPGFDVCRVLQRKVKVRVPPLEIFFLREKLDRAIEVPETVCQRRLNFDPPWTENAEVKLTHPRPYY